MEKITVDARGELCPMPLIMLKKQVDKASAGTPVEILTDNDISCSNLEDYIHEIGSSVMRRQMESYIVLSFDVPSSGAHRAGQTGRSPETQTPTAKKEAQPTGARAEGYAIAIASDCMGSGDEELGRVLLRAFINAIKELDLLPSHVVLYNRGVFAALKGSDTAHALELLAEEMDVKIIVCGTCVDYYGLKDHLQVGQISNMYSIMQILSQAHHIIRP